MIADGATAQGFWNVSMTLILDPVIMGHWPHWPLSYETEETVDASEDRRPWKYIFCSDELPTFCRLLSRLSQDYDGLLRDTELYIVVNPAIWNGQAATMDSNEAGRSRGRKLLEPLRQLHSFGAAYVDGPLSGSYKLSINQSVCKHCPTAMEIIEIAMATLGAGDEQVSKGRLVEATRNYKVALSHVRSCCWLYDERDFIMDSGPFPGLEAAQVMSNLKVRLQARIASVYWNTGMYRMARIYTERALDPRRPCDHRGNKTYTIDIEPWEGMVYAEVLHLAAQYSYRHGSVLEAVRYLRDAGELVPLDEEQKARYEAWDVHGKSLLSRRSKEQERTELDSQKRDEKIEGIKLTHKYSIDPEKRRLTSYPQECSWLRATGRKRATDFCEMVHLIWPPRHTTLRSRNCRNST